MRSERTFSRALAEMYVLGVSTRKVAYITEYLAGTTITSSQVVRANANLDIELEVWRNHQLD